jgi:hypothetical protein
MGEKKSFLLRLNLETWRELERWAADEFRSVNGQIEFILHEAIRRERNKEHPAAASSGASVRPKEET